LAVSIGTNEGAEEKVQPRRTTLGKMEKQAKAVKPSPLGFPIPRVRRLPPNDSAEVLFSLAFSALLERVKKYGQVESRISRPEIREGWLFTEKQLAVITF